MNKTICFLMCLLGFSFTACAVHVGPPPVKAAVVVIPDYGYGWWQGTYVPCWNNWFWYKGVWVWGGKGPRPVPPRWVPDFKRRPMPPPPPVKPAVVVIPDYGYGWWQGTYVPRWNSWFWYKGVWVWGGKGPRPVPPRWVPDFKRRPMPPPPPRPVPPRPLPPPPVLRHNPPRPAPPPVHRPAPAPAPGYRPGMRPAPAPAPGYRPGMRPAPAPAPGYRPGRR